MLINIKVFLKLGFLICIAAILYLATTTREIEVVTNSWDKLNHIFAFSVLWILLSLSSSKTFIINFIRLLFFAILIEVIQYFIPGREFSLLDIVADIVGIIFGYLLVRIYMKLSKKFEKELV